MKQKWELVVTENNPDGHGVKATVRILGVSKADCIRNFAGMLETFSNDFTVQFVKF